MKFTNERYPFIKLLIDGNGSQIDCSGIVGKNGYINDNFTMEGYSDRIEYQCISQTFLTEAISHAQDMMMFYKYLKPCLGCILEKNFGIFYAINSDPTYSDRGIFAFILSGKKFLGFAFCDDDEFGLDKPMTCRASTHPSVIIDWSLLLLQIIVLNLLKQFAKTETVFIGGSKGPRKTEIAKVKYLSDLPVSVVHYDCSFFRECIRTEGFNVRTHLRLQFYPSTQSYKFIIIDAYRKNGYHRHAKKDLVV